MNKKTVLIFIGHNEVVAFISKNVACHFSSDFINKVMTGPPEAK